MRFDPFGDGVEYIRVAVLRPLWVKPDDALSAQVSAAFGEGGHVFVDRIRSINDEFKFIRAGDVVRQWQLPALRTQCDPIKVAVNREGTAGFEVHLLANRVQRFGEFSEVVYRGLAASDYGEFGLGLCDFGCERGGLNAVNLRGNVVWMPGASGVAPWAMHGAAEGADEVRRPTGMRPFALEGVELFVDWEHAGGSGES